MPVTMYTKVNTQFTGRTPEKREKEKQAIAGGGAVGAAVTAANNRAAKSGAVAISSKNTLSNITGTSKLLSKFPKKIATTLTETAKDFKFIKDVVSKNKVFRCVSAPVGFAFGTVALLSSIGDIGKAVNDTLRK